jgi:phage FluMu gp28-like protein
MLSACKKHGLFTAATDDCPKCAAEEEQLRAQKDWFGVAGQDLARVRDYSAYVSLKVQDGTARIKRIYMWPHVNYDIVMRETVHFCHLDNVRSLHVDRGSAGIKVVEDYFSMGMPVEGVNFTNIEKQAMIEYYRDVGRKGLFKLPTKGPFVEELRQEISEQERIQGASEIPSFGHPEGHHDDLFWSLMLAVRAAAPWLTEQRFAHMAVFEKPMADTRRGDWR